MKRALTGLPAWTAGLSIKRQRELAEVIRAHEASCHRAIYEVGKEVEQQIRAQQPGGWRVDAYNSGHRNACRELAGLAFPGLAARTEEVDGYVAWVFDGKAAEIGTDGRLHFGGPDAVPIQHAREEVKAHRARRGKP